MEKQGFKTTSQYFRNAGTIWFILGILLSIVGHLELTQFLFQLSDVIWYGKLQPVLINIFIFGSILSYFFGAIFEELDNIKVEIIKPTIVGSLTFAIYQISLIFGIIVLMYGYNQGRSYGELNFIADNLFMLVFTIVIVLTLIYAKKSEQLTGSLQFSIITLAGIITTYFLGNFGFPNSYITTVPPTSGFQDALVQGYYKTSIFVFYIALPLLFLLYTAIKNVYAIKDEDQNFIYPLMILVLLVAFSSGAGLEKSAFRNFWTIIGDYIFASINMVLLGIAYMIHRIYHQKKEKQPSFILTVGGTLLSILFFYNFIISLPVIHKYFQYTFSDSFVLYNKLIYILLPIYIAYNNAINFNLKKNVSSWVSFLILFLGIIVFLIFSIEGIVVAKSIYGINQNELMAKDWNTILDKNLIFINIRMIIDIVFLLFSIYIIPFSLKENNIIEQKQAA
ncbi:MAG: hypothetical protein KatS3mg129_1571 [Leptospiraceae bacterium]|nr:MAG: hypothetical protein KatS3mg129_1571 [Leptospiraceae bacterium]